jgi:hypothetical protein
MSKRLTESGNRHAGIKGGNESQNGKIKEQAKFAT